jgi:hypothetical protein
LNKEVKQQMHVYTQNVSTEHKVSLEKAAYRPEVSLVPSGFLQEFSKVVCALEADVVELQI